MRKDNPAPAHELHRDHPGSMNIGIMLTDVEPGDNGATAIVPGSQWSAIDPRLAKHLVGPFEINNPKDTMIEHIYATRAPLSISSLAFWAKLERRIAEWISSMCRKLVG